MGGSDEFLFRPDRVHVPFGAAPDASRINLVRALFKNDIALEDGRPERVDTEPDGSAWPTGAESPMSIW